MKNTKSQSPGNKSLEPVVRLLSFSKILLFLNLEKKLIPFAYLGKSSLTARGVSTGRYYHFPVPGAVLEVDLRDAKEMRTVPNLKALARG